MEAQMQKYNLIFLKRMYSVFQKLKWQGIPQTLLIFLLK